MLSRLPAPHRFTRPVALTPATPDDARGLIGHRDPRTALAFALDTAAVFREVMRPTLDDRDALLAWAEQRGAFATIASGPLLPGDLLTFIDPTVIAVVLGTDARGVTDLCYLGGGVVRRGYLDPARPTVARDREGHVVNSYLRHGRDDPPPGTRYLAGELASGRIRL